MCRNRHKSRLASPTAGAIRCRGFTRGVAQLGSALRSGRRGRGFESRHPDCVICQARCAHAEPARPSSSWNTQRTGCQYRRPWTQRVRDSAGPLPRRGHWQASESPVWPAHRPLPTPTRSSRHLPSHRSTSSSKRPPSSHPVRFQTFRRARLSPRLRRHRQRRRKRRSSRRRLAHTHPSRRMSPRRPSSRLPPRIRLQPRPHRAAPQPGERSLRRR
jgi:hypothetical protein